MIRRLLEALFRHKLLLLLPPLIIPGIVTPIAILTTPPVYETAVGVWVDHPAYLNYKDGFNPWITPVSNQTGRLSELLRTRTFLIDVAQRTTTLAPLLGSAAGEVRLAELIGRSVAIGANGGDHLMVIRVQSPTARLSYELCKALVDAYQEKTAADLADQADIAVQFYEARQQDAQVALTKATQDLRRYVGSRSLDGQSSSDTTQGVPAALLDPRLAGLQTAVQQAQTNYNQAQTMATQAQHDALASAQGQQYGFQVLDQPQVPTAPTPQTKKIIIYPIAAAVAGLGVSALLLVLLVASDRSVRSEADLAAGLRVAGIVPNLKVKRAPKQFRGLATRRAIGAVAGTALPAPSGAK
jgi:uncharacterized protein involved in exopolysaccharide biosynthesis